jgi:RNA polymerase-associated protein
MMTLYSGTTCPFSQRCRFVLYEKGMDFQIIDVDLFNKPEDLAVMNPYNQVPVLVENRTSSTNTSMTVSRIRS